MTGRQLSALLKRHRQAEERTSWQVGLLCSTLANFSMRAPKVPLSAEDFMPGRKVIEPTDDEIAEDFANKFSLIAVLPGVVLP
ncbi:MAG TPA: hypothetical protein VII58_00600 [Acidobacteriaceae bacterium]